nr:alpha/beta hydrolase [Nocardia brasiliensis]
MHEFGHAVDDAFSEPSQALAFDEVHRRVLPLIQQASLIPVTYYAQPGYAGKAELFAESFAWYYGSALPRFFSSVAGGRRTLRPFHDWILQSQCQHLRVTVLRRLQDLSVGLSEDIYRRIGRQIATAATEFSNTDHPTRRLIGASADFHATHMALPTDPRQLYSMWRDLSRADRDMLHRADPFIGNRNGIPQIDRDHYNRKTLRILQELAEWSGDLDAIDNYNMIRKVAEPPGRYLSLLDDRSRVAIANGNPDSSENVVIIPAVAGRKIYGALYLADLGERLRHAALRVAPGAETSTIAWVGYEPAIGIVESADASYARAGAPLLRDYLTGLRATHDGPPSHNTVIGYSYGAVTTGHAAMRPLDADKIIFLGSFGTGVEHAADLRLTGVDPTDIDDHVFSTMAAYDSIQLMPATHGPLPTSPEFGGTVFETESTPGTELAGDPDPWSAQGWNPDDHRVYFDSDSRSLASMALIATDNWARPRESIPAVGTLLDVEPLS